MVREKKGRNISSRPSPNWKRLAPSRKKARFSG
jgi:hypothetical protein